MKQLTDIIMNYADVDEIRPQDNFKKDLGLSSFDTVCLITEIREKLGIELTPQDFVKCKTVEALFEHMNTK